jgi:hypothetical protein
MQLKILRIFDLGFVDVETVNGLTVDGGRQGGRAAGLLSSIDRLLTSQFFQL